MRFIKKMPSPQGAAAGQTATVNLPIGWTYHQLLISMKSGGSNVRVPVASWGSNIDEVRVMINGDTKIKVSAEDLVSIHQFYGVPLKPGELPIMFSHPRSRTIAGEDVTAYGTLGLQSVTLEIDVTSGITLDDLEVRAIVSAGTPLGAHYTLRRYYKNVGVTGEIEVPEIKRGRYQLLAFHIKSSDIDAVEVEADNLELVNTTPEAAEAYYEQTGRTVQTGWTHIDLASTDRMSDAFSMDRQDFRIRANFTAIGNPAIYTENVEVM